MYLMYSFISYLIKNKHRTGETCQIANCLQSAACWRRSPNTLVEKFPGDVSCFFALCSCSLPGGEGLPREGPGFAGRAGHSALPGVRLSSALFLLVQGGRTAHIRQRRPTQTRCGTHCRWPIVDTHIVNGDGTFE